MPKHTFRTRDKCLYTRKHTLWPLSPLWCWRAVTAGFDVGNSKWFLEAVRVKAELVEPGDMYAVETTVEFHTYIAALKPCQFLGRTTAVESIL